MLLIASSASSFAKLPLVPAIEHCLGFLHILPISLPFPPTFHFEYILKGLKNITVSTHMSTTQILLLFYCTSFLSYIYSPFYPSIHRSKLQSPVVFHPKYFTRDQYWYMAFYFPTVVNFTYSKICKSLVHHLLDFDKCWVIQTPIEIQQFTIIPGIFSMLFPSQCQPGLPEATTAQFFFPPSEMRFVFPVI